MNVVDSSGWLEYFANESNADFFAGAIEDIKHLAVPTICVLEVFKKILQQRDEEAALQGVALMQQGKIVELNTAIAISAAKIGKDYKIPLADSVVLATAHAYQATLWTQDADFRGIPGVRYRVKKKRPM